VQYVGENGGTGSVSGATVSGGFQFVGFSGGTGTATGATISGGVQYVGYSGGTGTASGVTVLEAGKQFVGYDGTGQATGTTVGAGANQYVGYSSGTGAATDTTISGGAQYVGDVSATGSADNTTIDGGEQYLGYSYGTGIAASTTIVSGYQYVGYSFASGSATGTLIDGGAQYVGAAISATGQATDTVIDGGAQYVGYNAGTGTASGTTISSGAQYVGDGELGVGTATDTLILNGGAQYVNSGGAATGDTLSAGGSAEIMSGAVADSVVIDGGTLTLDDGALVGAHGIAFAPDSNWGTLDLSAYGTFTPPSSFVISGFTGTAAAGGDTLLLPADIFDTEHLAWTQNSASQGTLQLIDDTLGEVVTSLTLAGTYDQNDFTLNQGLDSDQVAYAPCYRAGTRIATARGETAVEDLRVGDLVATASGGLRPVRWIGHRAVDLARHPAPENVWPVRVAAHAFGDNLPRRDLWVSPDHALAVDGALLRAIDLANGVSVAQVPCRRVDYWHVELDAHDILLAEGLPAESYLDTGNRTAFVDGGAFIEAFPDFKPKHWAQTCLPLKLDGERLARTKAHLIARLRAWGFDADADAAPHIVADGETFAPTGVSEWGLAFTLPEGRDNIALTSKTFVPAHIMPESSDTRRLGLCVARLRVDGADLPLDHGACPGAGWREAEPREGRFTHRWTDGAARLPAGARHIVVDLGGHGRFWRARAEDDVAFG
jgi:autotransporter passenger strand-loop-strand repeat protein